MKRPVDQAEASLFVGRHWAVRAAMTALKASSMRRRRREKMLVRIMVWCLLDWGDGVREEGLVMEGVIFVRCNDTGCDTGCDDCSGVWYSEKMKRMEKKTMDVIYLFTKHTSLHRRYHYHYQQTEI